MNISESSIHKQIKFSNTAEELVFSTNRTADSGFDPNEPITKINKKIIIHNICIASTHSILYTYG